MKRYGWICIIVAICLLFSCSINTLSMEEHAKIEKLKELSSRQQQMIVKFEEKIPYDAILVSSYLPVSVINCYTNFSFDALSKSKKIINDCQEILSNIPDNIDKEELRQRLLVVAIGLLLASNINKLACETELSMLNRGLARIEIIKEAEERLQEMLNNRSN